MMQFCMQTIQLIHVKIITIAVSRVHSRTKIDLTTVRARRNLDLRPGTEIGRQLPAG